jgi:hypothetical protein
MRSITPHMLSTDRSLLGALIPALLQHRTLLLFVHLFRSPDVPRTVSKEIYRQIVIVIVSQQASFEPS